MFQYRKQNCVGSMGKATGKAVWSGGELPPPEAESFLVFES